MRGMTAKELWCEIYYTIENVGECQVTGELIDLLLTGRPLSMIIRDDHPALSYKYNDKVNIYTFFYKK